MQFEVQQSRVIVEPIEAEDSELVIPNSTDEDGHVKVFKRLRVIAVGTGRILDGGAVVQMNVKEGDEVVVDTRFCHPLLPRIWYGDRELYVVDYAGVLVKVIREVGEAIVTHKPTVLKPDRKILVPN